LPGRGILLCHPSCAWIASTDTRYWLDMF
jgi:hypothetical protein